MTKAKKVTLTVFACLFAVLTIVAVFWYFAVDNSAFYKVAQKEFSIPGLEVGFTPQGLCYEKDNGLFLICGYMNNKSASRVYVVDCKDSSKNKYITLKENGEIYNGHAGGIETNGENVWIAGDKKVSRFSFSEVLSAKNGDSLNIIDTFDAPNGADFLTIENNYLWIGEFHRDGKYDTPQSHVVKTENGTNKAISFRYTINTANEYGFESTTPNLALSTPSLVQGMAITENSIILSTSYSLPNSHIFTFENILNTESEKTISVDENEVKLVVLEDKNLKETLGAPAMSEEIAIKDGRLYILFENACAKYSIVTREHLKNVYSIEIK